MSEKEDGGPAFPQPIAIGPAGDTEMEGNYGLGGMSLRDWFAGQALPSILADPSVARLAGAAAVADPAGHAAKCAYAVADAMLKARQQ